MYFILFLVTICVWFQWTQGWVDTSGCVTGLSVVGGFNKVHVLFILNSKLKQI